MKTDYVSTPTKCTLKKLEEFNLLMRIFVDFEKIKSFFDFAEARTKANTVSNLAKTFTMVHYYI